jgi:hypothetical protein
LEANFYRPEMTKVRNRMKKSTYMKTISSKQVTSNLASKTKTDTQEDFVKTMKEKTYDCARIIANCKP